MKDLYRDVLQNNQPVEYDKEDVKMIEEKIMKEQEMFEISEVNSIKEDTLKELAPRVEALPEPTRKIDLPQQHLQDLQLHIDDIHKTELLPPPKLNF